MSNNVPIFSVKYNPIKKAMIEWIENRFVLQPPDNDVKIPHTGHVEFTLGELEDGVRLILGNPKLSVSTIREHTINLKTGRYVTVVPTSAESPPSSRKNRNQKNERVSVSLMQWEQLRDVLGLWNEKIQASDSKVKKTGTPRVNNRPPHLWAAKPDVPITKIYFGSDNQR